VAGSALIARPISFALTRPSSCGKEEICAGQTRPGVPRFRKQVLERLRYDHRYGAGHTEQEFQAVVGRIQSLGYRAHVIRGVERTVIGAVGHEDKSPLYSVEQMPGVEAAISHPQPFKLASAEWKKERTVIDVGGVRIGGREIVIIAGPGMVEDEESCSRPPARERGGAKIFPRLRLQPVPLAVRPRIVPADRIAAIKRVREATGLKIVSEVFSSTTSTPSPSSPTSFRSARATVRISSCCAPSANCASPSSSSAHVHHHPRVPHGRRIRHVRGQLRRHLLRARHSHVR